MPGIKENRICCPHCGGENKNATVCEDTHNKEYFVYCETCGLETVGTYKTMVGAGTAFANGKVKPIKATEA